MKQNEDRCAKPGRNIRRGTMGQAIPHQQDLKDVASTGQDITLAKLASSIDISLGHTSDMLKTLQTAVLTRIKRWFESSRHELVALLEKTRSQIALVLDITRFNNPITNIYRKYHDNRFQFANYLRNCIGMVEVIHLHVAFMLDQFNKIHEFAPGVSESNMNDKQLQEYSSEVAIYHTTFVLLFQECKDFEAAIASDLGESQERRIDDRLVGFIPTDRRIEMARIIEATLARYSSLPQDPLQPLKYDVLRRFRTHMSDPAPDAAALPVDVQRILLASSGQPYMTRRMLLELFSADLGRLDPALDYLKEQRLVRVVDSYVHGERFYFPP